MNLLTTKELEDLEAIKKSNEFGKKLVTKNLNNNFQKVANSWEIFKENIKYMEVLHTREMETKPMELISKIEDGLDLESVLYREHMALTKKQVELTDYFEGLVDDIENAKRKMQKMLRQQYEEVEKATKEAYKGRG